MTILTLMTSDLAYAEDAPNLGQTIEIRTRLRAFVGKPSWLIVVRDLDHGQNIPHLFDIQSGENYWLIFTYSRNYLITISQLQMSTYRSHDNTYKNYQIHDFCHLESHGRIIRGTSISILIEGEIFPNSTNYTCHLSRYVDPNFTITKTQDN